jgi:hypothetical protein
LDFSPLLVLFTYEKLLISKTLTQLDKSLEVFFSVKFLKLSDSELKIFFSLLLESVCIFAILPVLSNNEFLLLQNKFSLTL